MQLKNKKQKFISLKEAAEISGYAPDYIGYLIRKDKISGKKIYPRVIWKVSRREILDYVNRKNKEINQQKRWLSLVRDQYISLKEAAKISGYAPDYIGYLIRNEKVPGKKIYSGINWVTTERAIKKYQERKAKRKEKISIKPLIPVLRKGFSFSFKSPKYGLVFTVLGVIIFGGLVAWAFAPKNQPQIVEIYSTQSKGDWQNPQNVIGPPEVLADGGLDSFSETNSAIYKSGVLSLIIQNFQQTRIEQIQELPQEATSTEIITPVVEGGGEEATTAEESIIGPTSGEPTTEATTTATSTEATSTEATTTEVTESISFFEKIKNIFKNGFVRAQEIPTFEDLTKKEFISAKIKFSFAIGEKEPDISIIEQPTTTESTTSESTSFWQKIKNFFSSLVIRVASIAKAEENQENTRVGPVQIGPESEEATSVEQQEATTTETIAAETTTEETLPNLDAKIIIWYSFDGEIWQELDTISSYPLSNALNGGYFSYDASFLKNWEDVKNLKIKFEGVVGGETKVVAYLDSVWVEVEYQEKEEEEGFELVAIKNDWRADEEPEFEIIPTVEKPKENIIEQLVAQVSEFFEEEPKVEANLIKPDDTELELKEGESFSAETHSPTKIKIFKPEDFRPGVYNLKVDFEKNGETYNLEQEFTWGVLGINVNKSIYLPNEIAYLQMAVLNEEGHTICDAELTLEVTAPDGTKTIFETPNQSELGTGQTSNKQQGTSNEAQEATSTSTSTATSTETTLEATSTEATSTIEEAPIEETLTEPTSTTTEATSTFPESSPSETFEVEGEEATSTEETTSTIETATTTNQIEQEKIEEEPTSTPENQEPESTPETSTSTTSFWNKLKNPFTISIVNAADDTNTSSLPGNLTEDGSLSTSSVEVGIIERSDECGPNSVTYKPDYYAYYTVGGIGKYQLKLTAVTKNGTHEITDSFEVREWVPFDVERIGPTRIWPFTTYEMKMIIKANEDFEGQVVEQVPASFEIKNSIGPTYGNFEVGVGEGGEEKKIIWQVDWKAGESYELRYQFDASDISPYLYLLGPLVLNTDQPLMGTLNNAESIRVYLRNNPRESASISEVFRETRAWQIAADATTYTQACQTAGSCSCYGYPQACSISADCLSNSCNFSCPAAGANSSLTSNTCSVGTSYNCLCYIDPCTGLGSCTDGMTCSCTISGTCTYTCTSPYEDCNASAADGCEINTSNDNNNCGGCGVTCGAGGQCISGVCRITVSGNAYEDEGTTVWSGCNNSTPNVALYVGGATSTASCSSTNGYFSFSNIAKPATSTPMVIWFDASSTNVGSNVNRYSGSGVATSTIVRRNWVIVQHDDSGPITNANIGTYDNANDSDINYDVDASNNLTVEAGSKLIVNTNDTFTPGGTVTIAAHANGDLLVMTGATLNGIYDVTVNGGDVTGNGTINLTGGTFLLDGTGNFGGNANWTFYNLTFGDGSGTATTTATSTGNITVSNDMSVATSQVLTGSKSFTVNGGDLSGNGTINLTGGTLTLNGTGYFGGTTNWTFYNLTFGGTGSGTTTATSTATTTISNVLTIAANQTLNAGSKTWTLTGSGTPFIKSGTFYAQTSTFKYTSSWLSGWGYRKSHVINSATGAGTNYPVKIVVHKSTSTDSGENVYLGTNVRDDFGDVRFTDDDGITLLDYWMESYATSASSTFWVEVKDDLSTNPATIYVYYGKADATTTSNGTNTFIFFDNFDDGDVSDWTKEDGDQTVESSLSADNSTYVSPGYSMNVYTKGQCFVPPYSGGLTKANKNIYLDAGSYNIVINDREYINYYAYCAAFTRYTWARFYVNDVEKYADECSYPFSGCGTYGCGWDSSTTGSFTIGASGTVKISLAAKTTDCTLGNAWFDNFAIRKYVSSEPTHGAWGSEENGTYITATTYNNLELLPSANGVTFTLGTTTGQTITTNGYLTIGDGTNAVTVTADTNDPVLDVNGNFTINASGTFVASNSATATFAGNWSNSGTFTHSTGTITFDGSSTSTLSGATTFYNLTSTTSAKTLQFATGTSATTTVAGTLTLNGGACLTQIKLRSTQSGQYWYLKAMATTSITYVDVQDSNATGSASTITATNSTDSGNNVKWSITQDVCAVGITISGKVYSNEGVTPLLTGPIVKLAINGTSTATTTASTTDGSYSFTNITQPATSSALTIFIDGTSTKAVTIDRYSGSGNATSVDLYQNRIIVRHDDSGPITIVDLDKYDSGQDGDILFTASSTAGTLTASSTSEFFVWSGKTFGAWGTAGVGGTTTLTDVDIRGTFTATSTQTILVSGNWDATTTATFNSASSTVEFATNTAKTIRTNGSPFWNLKFNYSGGIWTFLDNATTTNDLTITAGTASSTYNMYVYGGDATGNGTLNWTGSTFLLDGTGNFGGTSNWTFYNLTFGDGNTPLASTTAGSSGTTTISNILTIALNQQLYAGSKPWVLSGGGTPFVIDGTFNAQTSTFRYDTGVDTNITAATYYNLELIDPLKKVTSNQQQVTSNKNENSESLKSVLNNLWHQFSDPLKNVSENISDFFGIKNNNQSNVPKIINAYVEPDKVQPGDEMIVSAEIEDRYGIKEVKADMGGIETIDLKLVEGDIHKGKWQNTWNVHSVEVREYITTITATNILDYSSQTEVKWSDDPGLLTFKEKYVVSSTTTVATTSVTLVDDTEAIKTFDLAASQTVLVIYQANNVYGAVMSTPGMQNAINVDGTDCANSWDSSYWEGNYPLRNTVFWVGTLETGSHTIKGRFASNLAGNTATISNRVLTIIIFDGDEFQYVDSATTATTATTTFIDDPNAQVTFTPSAACKALILYNITNNGATESAYGKKAAINVAGTDYAQAEKSTEGTDLRDSVFTCHALSLSAVSTTVKGRFANAGTAETVTIHRRQLAVLLLADSTLLDISTSVTQVITTSNALVDDAQATLSRTISDTRELLVVAMGTKRHGVSSSIYGQCYGIKINANDRANSRGCPSAWGTTFADSAGTVYAEQLAAGSHTVQGRFSNNFSTNTAVISARQVVALWFSVPPTPTYTLAAGTFTILNNLLIGDGVNVLTVTADTNDPILDVNGNFTISANATFIASNSATSTFAGNWTNSGTFTHSTGTITFDGSSTSTLSGATTFYNLTSTTSAKTLQFATGTSATTTVMGTLTLNGQACGTQIKLRSTQSGQYWYLKAMATTSITYVDVQDSNATGSTNTITATNSTDSGNNVKWSITACVITVSGTVYSDEGTTNIGAGKTVRIKVNGSGTYSTSTDANGNYSIPSVSISAINDVVTVFLSGVAEKANTITLASTTSANISGLNLYQNRIIVRHEGTTTINIANLDQYDSAQDSDILFTASSTAGTLTATSNSEFFVWPTKTFGAWGTAGVGGTTTLTDVDIRGTFTATSTQTILVSGNWDATTTATFNSASSTVEFATNTAKTILTNGSPFWNLKFNYSGGIWTFLDNATTTNDLTITAGTASSTYDMKVLGGDVTGNGTLNWASSTFLVDGTGYFGGTTNWTFYHLTFGDNAAPAATTTATSTNVITVAGNLTIASNQALVLTGTKAMTISGSWTNNGTFGSASSTITFNATSSKTISGGLNGGNAFWKIQFNGAGGSWTIQDPMKVAAASTTDTFLIKQGTVQMGDNGNDNLEVLGNLVVGDGTGSATFTTPALPQASGTITIHINQDSASPPSCGSCKVIVGSSAGTSTLWLQKNTILKFNSATPVESGLEVESTGYLWIEGTQEATNTVLSISESTASTTITVSGSPWTANQFSGMHLRISSTASSTTAFGKIYDVLANTSNTIRISATTTPTSTMQSIATSTATRTICAATNTLITVDRQQVGRYIHDETATTGYFKIIKSTNDSGSCTGSTDQFVVIAEPDTNLSALAVNDVFDITDAILANDTFEILDYAQVTAATNTHGYIWAKQYSENLIRYADILYMGTSITNKLGISFISVDGSIANSGITIEKSRIHDGYYGVYLENSSNNSTSTGKGISNNAVYGGNSKGFYLVSSSNNTLTSNNSYGNGTGFFPVSSSNNTFTSNNSYGNSSLGFDFYSSSNNTLTSNNSYGNSYYGFDLDNSSNNTFTSNNSYGNYHGFSLEFFSNSTFTSNNSYGNSYGFYLYSSSNNTFTSNNNYGNSYGLYTIDSTSTIIINDNYGVNASNTSADIYFADTTYGSNIRCYNCNLTSPTEVSNVVTSTAYFISFKHDNLAISTKIWGEYTIPDNDTETPQNEGINKFNYASSTWEDSIARVNFYDDGSNSTKDTDLNFSFGAGFATSSASYRVNYNGSYWTVYRNEVNIGTTTNGTTFNDSTSSLSFMIEQGANPHTANDTYTFVAFQRVNNQNTQKIIEVMQADDKITVGSGKTLELKGGGGGANQDSQIIHSPSGTWDFDVTNGTTTVQEATINDMDLVGGTLTVLNTILNNETVVSGTLNVDWYLGIHVVAEDSTSTNIGNATCTISSTSTADTTIWKHDGTSWGTAATSQWTVTQSGNNATGTNPQPNNNGAIRVREYKRTSVTTTYYKYNLTIVPPAGFVSYNYQTKTGHYITSASSSESTTTVDRCVSENWYRSTIGQLNGTKDYDGLNQAPQHGTWYAGMGSDLQFSISSPTLNLTLNQANTWTATGTTILYATTSYPGGYIVKVYASNYGKLATSTYEIIRWPAYNATPATWDVNCSASSTCCGYGYTTSDSSLTGGTAYRFTNNTFCGAVAGNKCWAGFATSSASTDPVADSTSTVSGATTTITYKVSVNSSQTPGDYTGTVYYIATANY